MNGLMMDIPLSIGSIARYAEQYYPDVEIVSVTADSGVHRYTYADCFRRARKLASVLAAKGFSAGDRIATMAWNDYRHMEAYYGISASGLVCHTINPRLFAEQIVYIVGHAADRLLFVDPMFVPMVEAIADQLPSIEQYVVMTGEAAMPETSLNSAVSFDAFIEPGAGDFEYPVVDENAASALCYTSGTTGNPKGVLYSHRSTVLHAMMSLAKPVLNLGNDDCVLPVVPMFHVNAWGINYAAPIAGSKLVFPGPKMGDGEALYNLMEAERVTISLGVPTVWLALLQFLDQSGKTPTTLKRTVVGGAAVPASMISEFADKYGIAVDQGWGMTETSPIGSVNKLLPRHRSLGAEEQLAIRTKAGLPVYGVEVSIVDDAGNEQPRDGESFGALRIRGPWVCSGYYGIDESEVHSADGWFDTGDVATIDEDGFIAITDRTKDVIKSGGEWISSIDLENAAVGHPDVAEAAVIGVPHPKWTERPLLIVVAVEGRSVDRDSVLAWLDGKVARWWMPDDMVVVDEIPHTATGKILKTELRRQFRDYRLPEAE